VEQAHHTPAYDQEVNMNKVSVVVLALAGLLAGSALATCPDVLGIWSSCPELNPDFPMLNGRYSEGWCSAVGPLQPGNAINAMSWDGAALGLEWKMWGMNINAAGATLTFDGVTGGNGVRVYQIPYDGGEFWLSGEGSWNQGDDDDLYGTINDFLVVASVTYIGGQVVAEVANITFTGVFDACPEQNACVIEFGITNAQLIWRSDWAAPMPTDYPAFLCDATTGELFITCCITISINCAVEAEAQSWSAVKELFD